MDLLKKRAAYTAVDQYVKSNMSVGLGTGSTAAYVVERLAVLCKTGQLDGIRCVATSTATLNQAASLGLNMVSIQNVKLPIDICIDGADEVFCEDEGLVHLIKGRGGALFREKLVAQNSRNFVCVVDESKLVHEGLGLSGAFPIEVVQFGADLTLQNIMVHPAVSTILKNANFRMKDGKKFVTDNGNYVVDIFTSKRLENLCHVNDSMKRITGVVDTGLFIGMVNVCIVAKESGEVIEIKKNMG